MTTTKFSAIKLPHPKYSLEVAKFSLPRDSKQRKGLASHCKKPKIDCENDSPDNTDDQREQRRLKLPPTCLPRFIRVIQLVEVKESGHTIPGRVGQHVKDFLGCHVVIQNVRPELFLRRDFITKFVNNGTVFLTQIVDQANNPDYKLSISPEGLLTIMMNAKQYRRFGLVAKKVVSLTPGKHKSKEKCYCVEINLKDQRIMKNNRYQDKMVSMLRRLSCINKIYFRFVPDDKLALSNLSIAAANEFSVEFFKYVIEEYALDGCEPVPLTDCSAVCQRIERHWLNCAQLHPKLDLARIVRDNDKLFGKCDNVDDLTELVEMVDWLGYQLLSLDCDKDEIKSNYPDGGKPRYDVSCTQIVGEVDYQHVQYNLQHLFGTKRPEDEGVVLRALFLHDIYHHKHATSAYTILEDVGPYANVGNNSGVVYIQDCTHGSRAADEITVIGMSALAG